MSDAQGQVEDDAEICLRLLARGFRDLHDLVRQSDLTDPYDLPSTLGQAMSRLSRLCLVDGVDDIADSVHELSDLARRLPIGEWGVPAFATPFRYAELKLITVEPAVPTEECAAFASKGVADDIAENIHHQHLREAVAKYRKEKRHDAYSAIRGWIVRNPVYETQALNSFVDSTGLTGADDLIRRWSAHIPEGAKARDGSIRLCRHCGGLLYPHRDRARYPHGRCVISQCREEVPTCELGREIEQTNGWRVFLSDILGFWIGPGLAEVKLHAMLREAGHEIELYPRDDLADVGRYPALGIDVKSYSCPFFLGETLTRRLGGLEEFDVAIVAVPDGLAARRPGYLRELEKAYRGKHPVRFACVSDVPGMIAQ